MRGPPVVPGTRPVPDLIYPDPPGPDPPHYPPARYPENHYPDPPGTRVFGTRPITNQLFAYNLGKIQLSLIEKKLLHYSLAKLQPNS